MKILIKISLVLLAPVPIFWGYVDWIMNTISRAASPWVGWIFGGMFLVVFALSYYFASLFVNGLFQKKWWKIAVGFILFFLVIFFGYFFIRVLGTPFGM